MQIENNYEKLKSQTLKRLRFYPCSQDPAVRLELRLEIAKVYSPEHTYLRSLEKSEQLRLHDLFIFPLCFLFIYKGKIGCSAQEFLTNTFRVQLLLYALLSKFRCDYWNSHILVFQGNQMQQQQCTQKVTLIHELKSP